ncbi:MAG: ester cyclase [Opitutales bacterium]
MSARPGVHAGAVRLACNLLFNRMVDFRKGKRWAYTAILCGLTVIGLCAENDPVSVVIETNNALWNDRDLSILEKRVAEAVDYRTPYSTATGRAALRTDAEAYYGWAASNKSTFTAVAGNDKGEVFLRWESASVPVGAVKPYHNRGIDYYVVEDGLITTWITAHEGDSVARNKGIVTRIIDELWNQRDLTAIDRYFAPDVEVHITDFESGGREKLEADATRFFRGWSDSETRITHMAAEDDTVILRWKTTATHTGLYGDIPPTGKTLTYRGVDIYRLSDGRVTETWSHWDAYDVFKALGVIEWTGP